MDPLIVAVFLAVGVGLACLTGAVYAHVREHRRWIVEFEADCEREFPRGRDE